MQTLYLDYDLYKYPFAHMEPQEAWELIRMEIQRLQQMFKLGRAVVKRSGGGFLVKFPFTPLEREVIQSILLESKYVDRGYRYYSGTEWGQTLRIGEKKIVVMKHGKKVGTRIEDGAPTLWEVIG